METVSVSGQHLNVEVVRSGSLSWVNVERPGTAEMAYLRSRYDFHQLSLDDCLSVVQMPKLDEFDDHLFMVLHFRASTGSRGSRSPARWTSSPARTTS